MLPRSPRLPSTQLPTREPRLWSQHGLGEWCYTPYLDPQSADPAGLGPLCAAGTGTGRLAVEPPVGP